MLGTLSSLDLALIALYLVLVVAVGVLFTRQAGRSMESFFVGDRKLSWWVAGTSMVATTFAADTPLLVAGIVAVDGIAGNWIWWSVAIAHLSATFFFARMWKRSGVITDAEITELRYGGRSAAALRALKAIYFGLFTNCLTMAWVILAMVKISQAFFQVEPAVVISICVTVAVTYTLLGGFRSVVMTDLMQFVLGAGGAILLAVLVLQSYGGLGSPPTEQTQGAGLLGSLASAVSEAGHRSLDDVLDLVPPRNHPTLPPIFFLTLLIAGWWRWAEGTGYLVQRMAACRDESHAQGAMLWFSVLHNALRPWPWIVVGLASLILYPELPGLRQESLEVPLRTPSEGIVRISPGSLDLLGGGALRIEGLPIGCSVMVGDQQPTIEVASENLSVASFAAFPATGIETLSILCPDTDEGAGGVAAQTSLRVELLDREMAYPLIMAKMLPSGLLGLVVASLLAAFMSTIDTHVNWGASYLVQDIYKRFLRPHATASQCVAVSRLCVVLLAALAGLVALQIQSIALMWRFLVTLGAGLGSVGVARWFWPRVTAYCELAAFAVTTLLAAALELYGTPTLFGGPNPLFVSEIAGWLKIVVIAVASLATWIPVALLGPRNEEATLRRFATLVRPPNLAWAAYRDGPADPLAGAIWRFGAGMLVVFGSLFGIGKLMVGSHLSGWALIGLALVALTSILRLPIRRN